MKQNLIADYLSCILFRAVSFFTAFLPVNLSLFLGRRLGDLIYLFDRKHRAVAYANIKKTVAESSDWASAAKITRKSYQAFGQNLVEISFIPRINKKYLEKYIHIENRHYGEEAFKRGKGVILLIVHEGNWELSNIICANLGVPFVLFVRDQGFPRLNALLNTYRLKQGAKIIHKSTGIRQLVEVLKSNQSIGMTVDQGGKKGLAVNFFGKDASMSTGAVKLALKYDCAIIPIYYTRIKGAHTKLILDQVFTAERSGNPQNDLQQNLQRLISIYEKYLRQYPYEYLWTYKIYKYSKARNILILSDGKTGHLRQSEGVAKLIIRQLAGRGIKADYLVQEVAFRRPVSAFILGCLSKFSGRYQGAGCGARFLRYALTTPSWQNLMSARPDFIISAGSSISAVNYFLSREYQAKSVVLMRPGYPGVKKFNLVIIPKHDNPSGRGVVVTEGALNLIDPEYLSQKVAGLKQSGLLSAQPAKPCLGLLLGGNSRKFFLTGQVVRKISAEVKKIDADILISTSRRSGPEAEDAVKDEFRDYARCKLLVIAGKNNHPDVLGGILGLSDLVIVSPESISMISEAVCANKYVVVFNSGGLSAKHRRFLENYQKQKLIYLEEAGNLASRINQLLLDKPPVPVCGDNIKVSEGLSRIL